MMKNLKVALLTIIATTALVSSANAVTVNAAANAIVLQPLTLVQNTALNFGTLAAINSGSNIVETVPAIGAPAAPVNATLVSGNTPVAGQFAVTGDSNYAYNVTVAGTSISGANGGTATLSNMTYYSTNTGNGTSAKLAAGVDTLSVGGTLTVVNGVADTYSIPYTVTANY